MLKKLQNILLFSESFIRKQRRSKYWRKKIKEQSERNSLTPDERNLVNKVFLPYRNKTALSFSYAFHSFYKEKTGKFSPYFVPDDLYYCYIDPFYNDWNAAKFIDNKCLYNILWGGVKQPQHIAIRVKNIWKINDRLGIIEDVLCRCNEVDEIVIKKATDSEGGHGIFFCKGNDREDILRTLATIDGDIVIQKSLKQHSMISAINATSINTIRILTLIRNNEVTPYSSVLRMGIKGGRVDNASSGGITCGIDSNGKLKKYAYTASGDRFTEHPDSKIKFHGYDIPSFNKAVELVKELAVVLPQFRLVSWDMAIDCDGEPVLIEANLCYGELDFHQLNNGPLFGKDTDEILEEVFH